MRMMTFALCLIVLFPTLAYTGQIFGSLREGRRSVGQGVPVEVICGRDRYPARTDAYGSYNIYTPKTGKCTFVVNYNGQSQHVVYSYSDPVRYDFELIQSGRGYQLRRR
jgi:hypothetical protein